VLNRPRLLERVDDDLEEDVEDEDTATSAEPTTCRIVQSDSRRPSAIRSGRFSSVRVTKSVSIARLHR
jgi:hypothetical protein